MKNLTKEQIKDVFNWMNTWEQLKGTEIPLRFKEEYEEKLTNFRKRKYDKNYERGVYFRYFIIGFIVSIAVWKIFIE